MNIQVGFKGAGFKLKLFVIKQRKGDSELAYFRRAKTQEAASQYLKSTMQ